MRVNAAVSSASHEALRDHGPRASHDDRFAGRLGTLGSVGRRPHLFVVMDPSARQGERLTMREVWLVLGNVLALVVGLVALWSMREMIAWVLVALLFALGAQPAVQALVHLGWRRGWAVAVVFSGLVALIVALVSTLVPMLFEQARELSERVPDLLMRVSESTLIQWAERELELLARLEIELREQLAHVAKPALTAAASVLRAIAAAIAILVLAIFMLLFGGEVVDKTLAWVSPTRRALWYALARRARLVVGGYVLGTFLVALVGGTVMGVTLAAIGVPYFVPLALMMVVLGIIPYLGGIIGALLIAGITFASAGLEAMLVVGGIYVVYQQVENNLILPLIQRRTIRMNPLLIALALLGGMGIAGLIGALLALPIAGLIQVLLQEALVRRQARWGEAKNIGNLTP